MFPGTASSNTSVGRTGLAIAASVTSASRAVRRPCTNLLYLYECDDSSECAHVSINQVACYRIERTLMGCADLRGSVYPISVRKFTKTKTKWESHQCDTYSAFNLSASSFFNCCTFLSKSQMFVDAEVKWFFLMLTDMDSMHTLSMLCLQRATYNVFNVRRWSSEHVCTVSMRWHTCSAETTRGPDGVLHPPAI